ncbi:unnamed protein product, partial [Prorocentrum cordatum]
VRLDADHDQELALSLPGGPGPEAAVAAGHGPARGPDGAHGAGLPGPDGQHFVERRSAAASSSA